MDLYIGNVGALLDYDEPEVRDWASIYKLIALNVSLVDRANVVEVPFRFKVYPPFEFARVKEAESLSYEACCDLRARELLALQDRLGLPIVLLYSGGIDSTLVLVSFAKVLSPSQLRERIQVFMSNDSIVENPNFYYGFVRKNCTLRASEEFTRILDRRHIVVGGEHNDQLFGSDLIAKVTRDQPFGTVHKSYTKDSIVRFFAFTGMSEEAATVWYELIVRHIEAMNAPVETTFQFFWWLNFMFKWQSVYFRILLRIDKLRRGGIDQDFCENYYHHFFSTPYFQKWSYENSDLKIKDTWASYKFTAKDLIYDFNRDDEYRRNKLKFGSLSRLFLQKETAFGLTSDFQFLDSLKGVELYNANNSFKQGHYDCR